MHFGIGLTGVILISTIVVKSLDLPVLRKPYRPYAKWPDYVPTDSDNDEKEVDDL